MRNEEKYKADSVAKVKGDVIEFPIAGLPLMKTAEHLLARCPGAKFFPLTAGTKIPLSGSRGYLDATADLESLSEGVMYGDTGLAWVPGGLTEFVLDVDIKGDHHGATNLCRALGMNVPEGLTEAAAIDRLVDQLDTLMIQSPSGGLHIVLRHGLGHHVAWPTRPEGIDFRAGTGYLVMPNTALPEGTYTVIKDRPVAPAPETILAVLMPADDPAGADFGKLKLDLHPRTDSEEAINFAKERLKTIAPAAQGSHGDDRTVTVARWLYDWGIHPQTALDLMLEHWNDRCSPPWDADDLAVKIGSAYATSIRQGRKHGARIASGEDALGGYESTVDDFPAGVLSTPGKSTAAATDSEKFPPLRDPWREYCAPAFPMDVLPPNLRAFVTAKGKELGADASAIAMSVLTAISGALTHDLKLEIRPDFEVSGRLWTLLIGPPSYKKSPVQNVAMGPLRKLDARAMKDHASRIAHMKADPDADKKAIEVAENSPPPQAIVNDITVEKLADVLSRQCRSVLVHQDELASWIGGIDRYKGPSKGASADRGFWLKAYDGGPYNVQRMGRKTLPIGNLSVSVLGGIQPALLSDLTGNMMADGLLQRFVPVMMTAPTLAVENGAFDPKAKGDYERLIERLNGINVNDYNVHLSSDAKGEFRRIEVMLHHLQLNDAASDNFSSFLGKLTGLWGSLALILHMAWGNDFVQPISLQTARMASRMVEDFIIGHGLIFYEMVVDGSMSEARNIAAWLTDRYMATKAKNPEAEEITVSARDLTRGPSGTRGKQSFDIVKMMQAFIADGWLDPEDGQWNCTTWVINPAVAQFEDRAKAYRANWEKLRTGISASTDVRGEVDTAKKLKQAALDAFIPENPVEGVIQAETVVEQGDEDFGDF